MFSAEQVSTISTNMGTAISNIVSTFVSLTPVMATIAGVGFGIAVVRGLFNRISNGN